MTPRAVVPLLALAAALWAGPAAAQASWRINLTVSGLPLTFPVAGGAEYDVGWVEATSETPFVVQSTAGPGNERLTTVYVRCGTPCPEVGRLQWRHDGQPPGTWTTLTAGDEPVEARVFRRGGANDPWGRTIRWRYLLDWEQVPEGTSLTFPVVFTLVVGNP